MRLLLDTHLLLWTTSASHRLSRAARRLIGEPDNELWFSSASIWELAVKSGTRRADLAIDVRLLRHTLLIGQYIELPVTSEHALAVADLPLLHKDPFDRLLIAQCVVEGLTLLTSDRVVARYPGPIQQV